MEATPTPAVDTVAPADVERAVDVIVLAFSADPVARWAYPDPRHTSRFSRPSYAHLAAGLSLRALRATSTAMRGQRSGASLPEAQTAEFAAVFEERARHHPSEAHWYLPMIGVDPTHQRKGCGAALLRETLRQCDRDHLPAYLESSNPANINLYQRHGFEVRGTIRVGSPPPLFPMLRTAR